MDDAVKAKAAALRAGGFGDREIARTLSVDASTIRRHLGPNRQPRGPWLGRELTVEEVVAAYAVHRSVETVAAGFGVSRTPVRDRLAKAGVLPWHPSRRRKSTMVLEA